MTLKDSVILVTGGSLGLGKATARALVAAGAKVLITGRDAARVTAAAADCGATAIVADVSRAEDVEKTVATIRERFGRLDVLVNNAGIGEFRTLDALTLEDFEQVFRVNVFGAALMAQAVLPFFREQGRGHIVNIGSTAALNGFARGSIYAASKFALRAMTQCWQAELRRENIRVMLVNPSEVPTAFASDDRVERPLTEKKLTPDEIAHAIRSVLEMDDRGMIPELSVWATNPW
ncbi:MAG: SDR family oxidoreductase [Candidatus Delongbacteria bacterium]|nr:SDR family oxidoreductase [Candidatus Cloacimonadota bacterium]MCB9474460.1 SDR family oxidoreductase [Candidatus Delongbacteria bacterium]